MRRWALGLGAAAGAGVLLWWLQASQAAMAPEAPAAATGSVQAAPDTGSAAPGPGPAGAGSVVLNERGQAVRQERLATAQQRYERAAEVYSSYRDATRYPHHSRPLAEHPDQARPFDPVQESIAFKDTQGQGVKGLRLRTSQDRVFVSGNESVVFSVAAVDDDNRPVALQVTRAQAQSVPDTSAPIQAISAAIAFNDEGASPDRAARDGVYSARFTPAQEGYARQNGTIRVLVDVRSGADSGVVQFDVVYTGATAGQWLGVREAVENGSLHFYLKAQVREPGRYVASARVYDAQGRPFALLQFNDELKAGAAEMRLQLFGALIRDKNPSFPLQLVDVDGFLLKENAFPDRMLMPRQAGVVHTSQRYTPSQFSAAEWSSEERERYLREYSKDLQTAQDALKSLQ
ncbi:MAG: choice-of-anchor X domain-containing protein [Rhodoferax sp.]